MPWDALTSIATVISMIAFVLTALYIRGELKALEKDRYLAITNQLFSLWQSKDFMESQLWLLYRLKESSWSDFVRAHRADVGESAFHRVGAFYDRVGTLVRLGLVNKDEILITVGAHAIAVWQKIHGLVQEARRIEHSTLFADFERLLPSCHECYVPALGSQGQVSPFSLTQPEQPSIARVSQMEAKERLDRGDAIFVDVRAAAQLKNGSLALPDAIPLPAETLNTSVLKVPLGSELIVYCA